MVKRKIHCLAVYRNSNTLLNTLNIILHSNEPVHNSGRPFHIKVLDLQNKVIKIKSSHTYTHTFKILSFKASLLLQVILNGTENI